ncbi:thioredoxin-like domain-containing protein [Clostridium sp. Marseille-Q2269]|uniref:thioredoxin-like domain-containing protein n=1 Tax=Clostridium sp. Marseille-Q2269 TaxID=2942205 RepID=UPI002072E161|nr:thioredoxin-like domain-containing protein [Clostridium sp. Marseille-Q2269]
MSNLYEKYKNAKVHAPNFPITTEWLGTKRTNLDKLKNRVILLDFWTFCCINCIHVIEDLEYLERKYGNKLQVIGVHSPKFKYEKNSKAVLNAMKKYGINHPVVNDKNKTIWDNYTVNSWPTFVLIDPEGYAFAMVSGEGNRELLDEIINDTIQYFDDKINWSDKNIVVENKCEGEGYIYPSKISINESGLIAFSEKGKNRIIILDEKLDEIKIIGNSKYGLKDGNFKEAEFKAPEGIRFIKNKIYVADTENHTIRECDLEKEMVKTIAGNGEKEYSPMARGDALNVSLNSPWDLEIVEEYIYIAMAGNHQIWKYNMKDNSIESHIGTGGENIRDGSFDKCLLAQTSALSYDGKNRLYFIDSETSSIRYADLEEHKVHTLIGKGLFYFGNKIGNFENTMLQHPLDLKYKNNILYIADTYNNRIIKVDIINEKVEIIKKGLNEPNGIDIYVDDIYLCDTNGGKIEKISIK